MWAWAAHALWHSTVPSSLRLPHVSPSALFSASFVQRSSSYELFLDIDRLLASLTLVAVLALYARRGHLLMRESAAGRIGSGMLLGMLGFAIVWLAEVPFGLAAVWWERRHHISHQGYVASLFESFFSLGGRFLFVSLALLVTMGVAGVLAQQVAGLPCDCLQIDEANIPGNPADAPLAAAAINCVLDAFHGKRAVHLCFGNYGGQTIQKGEWRALAGFLNQLHVDHLVLEMAHRPPEDLEPLKDVNPKIKLGIGVIDVKINHIETPEEIARAIERAESVLGPGRVGWIHPDCGFWMLRRSIADRKIAALAPGRDLYLGRAPL